MSKETEALVAPNLREFRYQKRPSLALEHCTHQENMAAVNGNLSVNAKSIICLDSDSDDEQASKGSSTPAKSTNVDVSKPVVTATTVPAPMPIQPVSSGRGGPKSEEVIEKERQMKRCLQAFPHLNTMVVYDTLSRNKFDVELTLSDLARLPVIPKQVRQVALPLVSPRTTTTSTPVNMGTPTIPGSPIISSASAVVKQVPNGAEKRPNADQPITLAKRPAKRRRKSEMLSDDEDDDSADGHNEDFRDSRVFNSDEDSDVEVSSELTSDKRNVLDFMQSATLTELQLMSSCSRKKAQAIMESRPFDGWVDLVSKLESNKNLSTDLLNSAQSVLSVRNNVRQLMRRCMDLSAQLERAVAVGAANLHSQPRILSPSLQLTPYQMVGLNWLVVLHMQQVNGILADEMGLGKTIQVIAFLAYLKETKRSKGTHLVVVPASTLDNWSVEFARWCPELRVFVYYGSQEERRAHRISFARGALEDYDIILTTYTLLGNSPEERKMFRVTSMHYVVFDEAHMLKNMNTQRYENLMRINAKSRILLTGTPMQNSLLELMSLLIFVMPNIFAAKTDDLKSLFQRNSRLKQSDEEENKESSVPTFEREQIEKAKRIMRPFILRRLKKNVLQDLPQKTDHILDVPMVPTQKHQYEELVASYKAFSQEAKENADLGNKYSGMRMMTDLRKLSNHPLLLRHHYDDEQIREIAEFLAGEPTYKDTVVNYIIEDLMFMSDFDIHLLVKQYAALERFLLPDNLITNSGKCLQLSRMLPELQEEGHRVLIFSQYVIMLNILETYLTIKNVKYLRLDGNTPVHERQELIDLFSTNTDYLVFLLSTRAGGLGINLTAADTVIIHDIDFNPYNDKQAEDRCHRMGQMRPVSVYRLISKDSIEEAMLEMNREKLKLERELTSSDESDKPDVRSVVRLLSTALDVDSTKVSAIVVSTDEPTLDT